MKGINFIAISMAMVLAASCRTEGTAGTEPVSFSGIYPHLAFYNNEGECGTGAVVPWAGSLWAVTYAPHQVYGSSDKLYQISADLKMTVRPESKGGTPADRMIHLESSQLFIGPHVIDSAGNIRTLDYKKVPGRYTALARHMYDPENRIYLGTMEEGFYDIDVHTLEAKTLYEDGNIIRAKEKQKGLRAQFGPLLPGCHGKGMYSGQDVLVFSNNGEDSEEAHWRFDIEAGCLAEWDGKDWKVIRRNQFTEITGPGGIYGNPDPETDPIWALGWDYKSVIAGVRSPETGWSFFRLPKASFSYDGAHGWNTEWPRIRNVGTEEKPDYLMTMHGMFWRFPGDFSAENAGAIIPRGSYLKVIGDFTRWGDSLVFGCDDSAANEFLNKRSAKGNIVAAGQANSNLWFTSADKPDNVGPTSAAGALWLREDLKKDTVSDPFLFQGWDNRCAWITNGSSTAAEICFETDADGKGSWDQIKNITVEAGGSCFVPFSSKDHGIWLRARVSNDVNDFSIQMVYSQKETRTSEPDRIFDGLARVEKDQIEESLLYSLGHGRRSLGILAGIDGEKVFYEADSTMHIKAVSDSAMTAFMTDKFTIPENVITIDSCSVLITDDKGRRWRLPEGHENFDRLCTDGSLRICREVVTERDLFSCHGTFYELPAENADGYAKIRPIASHSFAIPDYATYRGLFIMSGADTGNKKNHHIVCSDDRKTAVWAGAIDDLWKLGKPSGHGCVWNNSEIKQGVPSDPYLIWGYDRRTMTLANKGANTAKFTVYADPAGENEWAEYASFTLEPGESEIHEFPDAFQARWIKIVSDSDTVADARFDYR